ncbi:acyl-phosphate--glycerol-3-phosphate O-acyltransferase [Aeromonas jandaei]|nr:acyl-phosphate--glycerol-3-phosphate O-acyltransferase [Aeromonas jandaei]
MPALWPASYPIHIVVKTTKMTALTILMIILAYLGGSLSSAVLVSRCSGLPDPRDHGSHNPGATNVLRLGGRLAALVVLLLDVLKGTAPVYLAWYLQIKPVYLGFIGVAACLGHMYPIFFHFRGGKGVATALGTMMPLGFTMGGAVIGTWLLVLLASGYSSLASIITVLLTPLFTYLLKPEYTLPVSLLSCLILIRHHENISRLLKGEEPRVWRRKGCACGEEVGKMGDVEQKRDERDKK